MTRLEKANRISTYLNQTYPDPLVPLDSVNAYTFLVAVLLSAQTTDKKVNEVTPALFNRASTPYEMVRLEVNEILDYIRVLGLAPTKAKNIKKLSQTLIDHHQGLVPCSFDELEALAGVGHKTASVVMAQIFGHPAFPIDTHIHRLAYRWGLSSGKNVTQTEKDLKVLFPKEEWNRLHLQIIFFGREHCPARTHHWQTCPICVWASNEKRSHLPKKGKSSKRTSTSKRT